MVSGDNEEEERQVEGDGKGLFRKQLEGLAGKAKEAMLAGAASVSGI